MSGRYKPELPRDLANHPAQHQRLDVLDELFGRINDVNLKLDEVLALLNGSSKDFFTVEEVARFTGRAPYTIRKWIGEGRIQATRVADTGPRGKLLIPREQLQRLIGQGRGGGLHAALIATKAQHTAIDTAGVSSMEPC